jgi:DNA uptake protein ComE-like DNA-binding protein
MAFLNWLTTAKQLAIPLGGTQANLRSRIVNDPLYRLQSLEEVAIAAAAGMVLDVNRAGVDDWLRLPGVSIHQAKVLAELTQSGVALNCIEDVAAAMGVSVARVQPLAPVLRFCYYDPESVTTIVRVNANMATVEQLAQVPAIDLYLAKVIVAQRRAGPYRNITHLQRRLGIAPGAIAELMHYLSF